MVHADFPGIDVGDWGYCSGMSWMASGAASKGIGDGEENGLSSLPPSPEAEMEVGGGGSAM